MQPDDATSREVEEEIDDGQIAVCKRPRSKLKHSRTADPIELLLMNMEVTIDHLLSATSYRSTEFKELDPSFPPIEEKEYNKMYLIVYINQFLPSA